MVTLSQKELQRMRVIEKAVNAKCSASNAVTGPTPPTGCGMATVVNPEPGPSIDPCASVCWNLATGKYAGFNDSHLRQKLVENEGLTSSRESVRRILRKAKQSSPQKRRPRQYRSRRPCRPRFGLMLLTCQRPLQELIEPKPAILSSALKRKPKPQRIYNLGGRSALSAVT
jgi:hypothetical protein